MSAPLPDTMALLPLGRGGLPVPHVAAWSSERWNAIRFDPCVDRVAVFSGGRQGRGRPLFGVLNEERQRAVVTGRRCGVCNQPLDPDACWLPHHPALAESTTSLLGLHSLGHHPVTTEPPCCLPCALWSAGGCPGVARQVDGLLRIDELVQVLQYVDPSREPAGHDNRFDGVDDPAERERLGHIARRHGGAVGYVKAALVATEVVALDEALALIGGAAP